MTPEIQQYLIYAAIALAGYLLRHWGITLPGMSTVPTSLPGSQPVTPATVGPLRQLIRDELQQLASTFQGLQAKPIPTLSDNNAQLLALLQQIANQKATTPAPTATPQPAAS